MIVLVDYDNIPELERNRGPVHIVNGIVTALGPAVSAETEIRFRLYGGWFFGSLLSRRAQRIAPALSADFPRTLSSPHRSAPASVRVRAELALALESAPGKFLTHTYRDRSLPMNVHCAPLPFAGCKVPSSCPIAGLLALIRDNQCPEHDCPVDLAAVLTKPEQKLVDTMITVDLLHLATTTTETISVVSSDDDIWPGIQAALLHGARIVHVHPLRGRRTPPQYSSLAVGHYSQTSF